MVCARCGRWTYRYRWCSVRDPSPEDWDELEGAVQDTTEPNIYWFRRCLPTCHANAILATGLRLEANLASYGVPLPEIARFRAAVWQAYEEIENAWIDLDR